MKNDRLLKQMADEMTESIKIFVATETMKLAAKLDAADARAEDHAKRILDLEARLAELEAGAAKDLRLVA